jgi:cytochrome c-type biogenesis protein CcmH
VNFWIGAALLCVLAMLFVVAPLWLRTRRSDINSRAAIIAIAKARLAELDREFANGILDEADYHELKLEQQRRLLQEADSVATNNAATRRGSIALLAMAIVIPLSAAAFYFHFGSWGDWKIQQLLEQSEREMRAGTDNRSTLEALGKALEQRLAKRQDDDGRRRFMLARIESGFGRYAEAANQFRLLLLKFPDDASLIAQHAQAQYLANDRRMTADLKAQAERALKIDPNQTTALGLLGIAAFDDKDYASALKYWRHLARLLPPGSPTAGLIERGVAQAREALGTEAVVGPTLNVSVSLSSELAAMAPPQGVLFVFARAVGGPPMPLAVARLDPAKLPLRVTLDDSMAMAEGMNLSSFTQVEVVARITAAGQVRGMPGDLEGSSGALSLDGSAQKVSLVIDRKL